MNENQPNQRLIMHIGVGSGKTALMEAVLAVHKSQGPKGSIATAKNDSQSCSEELPVYQNGCNDTIKLIPQLDSKPNQRKEKTFAEVEKKLKQLVLGYLRDASQDSLGKDYYYKRYDNEWKIFCTIKNKQQREVKLHPDGFKKNVEYFLELAKANTADTLKTDEAPVTEHRGETN